MERSLADADPGRVNRTAVCVQWNRYLLPNRRRQCTTGSTLRPGKADMQLDVHEGQFRADRA